MGILKVVQGANYSSTYVGKYDFITGIFRRKIVGGLERNYVDNNRFSLRSYLPVSLIQSDNYKIKFNFFKVDGTASILSICDYVNGRMFDFTIELNSSTTSKVKMKLWKRTTESPDICSAREYVLYLGTLVDSQEYAFEVDFNYSDLSFSNCKQDNVVKTLAAGSVVTGVSGMFTNGQTATVSIGTTANTTDVVIGGAGSTAVGYTKPSFIQLKTIDNTIVHFDFLGDTYTEKLLDKANGIVVVSRASNVPFVSVPLSI
jgi:hypothetical protein